MNRKAFNVFLTLCAFWLAFQPAQTAAFSLLGPYEAWMQTSNCFRLPVTLPYNQPGDIGGPMCISNGYRWNVPFVTYGFDQSLPIIPTTAKSSIPGPKPSRFMIYSP
jgi:hypothetical protein